MHKRYGFTLIEVLIALFLSCILVGFLLSTFALVQRGLKSANPLIDQTEEFITLYGQLSSDIQGMCIPLEDAQHAKVLDKVCWSTVDKGHLSYLTFISNNPLQFYSDTMIQHPHLVRIAYYMKKEGDGTFSLYRAQSTTITEWSEQQMSKYGYKIGQAIEYITVTFYASYYKNKKDEKKSLYEASVWQYDEWIKKNTSLTIAKIPQWVSLLIMFKHKAEPYVLDIEIPVYEILLDTHQAAEQNKEASKAAQQKTSQSTTELQKAMDTLKAMQSKGV